MTPQRLLIELRILNIRVRVDGDLVRCKPPEGAAIPADLVEQIRTLKPQLLELLREEAADIRWRAESGLLAETVAVQPVGACAYCGAKLSDQQTGKCVTCCLASAPLPAVEAGAHDISVFHCRCGSFPANRNRSRYVVRTKGGGMSLRGRDAKNRAVVVGARVQRRDRLPFTKRGTVLEIIEPAGSFDAVTRATVRWDDAARSVETWPVEFLVALDDQAEGTA